MSEPQEPPHDLNRSDRLLTLLEFATDLYQTSGEAEAELRADGVDVDAFLTCVWQAVQESSRSSAKLADVSDPYARLLHMHCGSVESRTPSSSYPGRLLCDSFFRFVAEEAFSERASHFVFHLESPMSDEQGPPRETRRFPIGIHVAHNGRCAHVVYTADYDDGTSRTVRGRTIYAADYPDLAPMMLIATTAIKQISEECMSIDGVK